ncbi:MAG: 4Fe-4S binding protein, partial [Pirellulales bacterium]
MILPSATASLLGRVLPGIERFPPPDFTDHQLPSVSVPSPEAVGWQYVWLALLVIGMAVTAYFALRARSRRGLLVTALAALVVFGFVRGGCVCSIGAVQNVTLGLSQPDYAVPWVVIGFFTLPLVFALFFGRVFCASVCPLGAAQEMVALKPVQVPRWVDDSLGLLAYVYLGLAVALAATGTGFVICRYDPFVGFFRLGATVNMLVFGGALLLVGVFVGRPYCRYLCPLGVLLRWSSSLSKWHLRIPGG